MNTTLTRIASTTLESEPTYSSSLKLTPETVLEIELIDDSLHYQLRSEDCPAIFMESVEAAVTFLWPHLGASDVLLRSSTILSFITHDLTRWTRLHSPLN